MQLSSVQAVPYSPQTYSPASSGTQPAAYNPYGDSFGTDSFSSVTALVSSGAGGGFAAYKLGAKMGEHMGSLFGNGGKGVLTGIKNMGITGVKGMGYAALIGAGVSALGNGVGVVTGSVQTTDAVNNVVSDTLTSAIGGMGAVTLGGVGNVLLSKVGMGGIPLTVATVALGTVGGVAAGFMKENIFN